MKTIAWVYSGVIKTVSVRNFDIMIGSKDIYIRLCADCDFKHEA